MPHDTPRLPARCIITGTVGLLCLVIAIFAAVDPMNLVHVGIYFTASAVGCAALFAVTAGMLPRWPVWARATSSTVLAAFAVVLLLAGSWLVAWPDESRQVVSRVGPNDDGVTIVVSLAGFDGLPEVQLRRGHGPFAQESSVYVGSEGERPPKARFVGNHHVELRHTATCTIRTGYEPRTLRVQHPRRYDFDPRRCR